MTQASGLSDRIIGFLEGLTLAGVGIEIQQVGIGIWDWAMRKSDVGTAIR